MTSVAEWAGRTAAAAFAAMLCLGASACQEDDPEVDALQELMTLGRPVSAVWSYADEIVVTEGEGEAALANWRPIVVAPTQTSGMHRIGMIAAPYVHRLNVWLRAEGDLGVMLEMGTAPISANEFSEYGAAFFDLDAMDVVDGPTGPATLMDPEIRREGDWIVVSGALSPQVGPIVMTLGLTYDDIHLFEGREGQALTIGGVEMVQDPVEE